LNHSQAVVFALRRFLLMPLIYVTLAGIPDLRRAKIYFNTYLIAAVLTALVYILFSYQYFISNLYNITQSGPSLFQYPITSSEILSITSVFLFAFLINEKGDLKYRLLIAGALFITVIALVATYKRTGWLGTGFGFFLIIFLKRDWKYIIPLLILVAALFIYEKNISEIKIFNIESGKLVQLNSFKTNGRAYDLTSIDGTYYVSDYEDGFVKYKGSEKLNKTETPSPAVSLEKWDKYLLGYFIDTRFITYRKDSRGTLKQKAECLPPGFTIGHSVSGDYLYALDSDSGLTIFKDPGILEQIYRNRVFDKYNRVFADSGFIVFFSPDSGVNVYNLINGIPVKILYSFKPEYPVNSIYYFDHKLFFSNDNGIKIYSTNADSISFLKDFSGSKKIFLWKVTNRTLVAADESGNIYETNTDSVSGFSFLGNPGFISSSVTIQSDTLVTSFVKRSRLLSIWDPYLPSNSVRLSLWKAGWKIFLDHPLFGVGDIDLAFLYKQYKTKYEKEIQGHMHNNFVHILVTLGIFGLLAFCYLLYRLFKIDLNIYIEMKSIPFASSYALGTIAALSTVIIAGLTEMNFFDHEIITLLWFTFGLNVAVYKRYKNKIP
jgi:O-antigen ligase